MSQPLKFTFDTAFGTRSENQKANENIPVITQDDVDAARTQGFIHGREDGLTEASNQFNSEFKTTLDLISNQLSSLIDSQTINHQNSMQKAENYALLIATKIAKTALNNYPIEQIKSLITECLSHINDMPHLVVRVHQSISELTNTELQPLINNSGFEGKVIILGEENIALGDCKIEWADGGIAHSTTEIIDQINTNLVGYFDIDADEISSIKTEVIEEIPANTDAVSEAEAEAEADVETDQAADDTQEVDEENITNDEVMPSEMMPPEANVEELTGEDKIRQLDNDNDDADNSDDTDAICANDSDLERQINE